MKLIINADDCGISHHVNAKIEEYINLGLITSTTIMSNMPAVDGAKALYNKYKDTISFGIHLNLTQGTPLLKNQMLLEQGIYCEDGGEVSFSNNLGVYNKFFNKEITDALQAELCAQIDMIKDLGIEFSHIDSHHHVHTRPFMLKILPALQKKYLFHKIRRMRNYMPFSCSRLARDGWWTTIKFLTNGLHSTDKFTSFADFVAQANNGFIVKDDSIVELMVHPGGYENDTEEPLLKNTRLADLANVQLINYNQL